MRISVSAAPKPTTPAQATTQAPGVRARRALPAAMRTPATRNGQRRPMRRRAMLMTRIEAGTWQMLRAVREASLNCGRPVALTKSGRKVFAPK